MVNYEKMYQSNNDYELENVQEKDMKNEEEEFFSEKKESFITMGKVANCNAAYIRENPTKDSNQLSIVKKGDELLIEHVSNTNWYKTTTQSGVEGYIMKELVSLD